MAEKLKNELLMIISPYIKDTNSLREINQKIEIELAKYEINENVTDLVVIPSETFRLVEMFIVSKKISGLSEKTLYLYMIVLKDFFITTQKEFPDITTNDIRLYLYTYQKNHKISNRTLDNKRTIICNFFNWLAGEEYICKNPAIKIEPIKYERKHKKAMTQLDLEKIRSVCETSRESAIVEMLFSTGCRVTELENLNRSDVDFNTKEVFIFGKGNKHRISYLNARAEVALRKYLNERTDVSEALFVYDRKPYLRLKKSGIENIIKNIENRLHGEITTHVTPHVFRHTTATISLDRGMSVVDVSRLLGHNRIETTMEYITVNSESVKNNHKNYVI